MFQGRFGWQPMTHPSPRVNRRAAAPVDRCLGQRRQACMMTRRSVLKASSEADEPRTFVLVGHSYAGMVISAVADTLRERASRYVYLDARLPFDMSPGAS